MTQNSQRSLKKKYSQKNNDSHYYPVAPWTFRSSTWVAWEIRSQQSSCRPVQAVPVGMGPAALELPPSFLAVVCRFPDGTAARTG